MYTIWYSLYAESAKYADDMRFTSRLYAGFMIKWKEYADHIIHMQVLQKLRNNYA